MRAVVIVSGALLLLAPHAALAAQSASELLRKGIHSAAEGRLEEATAIFEKALRLSPGNAEILNNLGVVLRRRGNPSAAIPVLYKALIGKPGDYRIHTNLALALRDAGKIEEAVAAMRRACSLPASGTCRESLALLELEAGSRAEAGGDISAAVAAYKRALETSALCGQCATALGSALLRTNDVSGAVEVLRRAVSLLPNHAPAHADLGIAISRSDLSKDAIPHLERAIALDPDHTGARLALARLLQRAGRADEARAHLEYARSIDRKSKQVMMARSLVNEGAEHLRGGEPAKAVAALERSIELDPANANARHSLGVALLSLRRFLEALRAFDAALAVDPRRADTLYYTGRTKLMLGDAAGAVQLLAKATEFNARDAWAWNALAVARVATKDLEGASEALRRALSLDPTNELFQVNRECLSKGCRLSH